MSTNKLFVHPFSIALDRDDQLLEVEAEFIASALPFRLSIPFAACNVHVRGVEDTLTLADYAAMSLDEDETPEVLPERDGQKEE